VAVNVFMTSLDQLLDWGSSSSLWVFPMATSCCGIELMAAAASRVDLDRMGTIVRATPRQADVMVVAGTITVKMAPRVKKLWDQMPEPKWCIAMGSCAISGDFYRDLYPVVPGIDTFLPVDIYVPGCPPNPEALMAGLLRLRDKIRGKEAPPALPTPEGMMKPAIGRIGDPYRDPAISAEQEEAALHCTDPPFTFVNEDSPGATTPAPAPAPVLETDEVEIVELARHRDVCAGLLAAGHRQLVYIVATHLGDAGFEVAYGLRSVGPGGKLASWRVRAALGEKVPSIADLIAGADWQEREQYDLVGVTFAGHPDLRRIMLPENWTGHPLRRDYPADSPSRPWR
jgi:NADH-quinone oxidoreductase subunit B/C/D